jgi:hypothetical protein
MVVVATVAMLVTTTTMVVTRETTVAVTSINAGILDIDQICPTIIALKLILRLGPRWTP